MTEDLSFNDAGVVVRPIDLPEVIPMIVLDPLDQPIVGLDVVVKMPGGEQHTAVTDKDGAIAIPRSKARTGTMQVSVKNPGGTVQPVCALDLERCRHGAIVRSNKVKVPLMLQQRLSGRTGAVPGGQRGSWFEKSLQAAVEWVGKIGPLYQTKPTLAKLEASASQSKSVSLPVGNHANNPIHVAVGAECPNGDNLRLGRNNVYRTAILKAAKHVGLSPHAMAALINAEAAKVIERIPLRDKDGKPIIDRKTKKPGVTKIGEVWDMNSYNTKSGAAGLTQFLASTWLSHAMTPGRYLHRECVAKGWVRKVPPLANGKSGRTGSSPGGWVFVLASGMLTKRPMDCQADANVIACLRQRFDPEWSIMAAADYGKANLSLLIAKGFKLSGLEDGEKAKLMYVMHHEGEGNGPLFIRGRLQDMSAGKHGSATNRMRHIFVQQIGEDAVKVSLRDAEGDVFLAYRRWLSQYVDERIDLAPFSCPDVPISVVRSLPRILEKIQC